VEVNRGDCDQDRRRQQKDDDPLNRVDLGTADRNPVAAVFEGVLNCRERAALNKLLVLPFRRERQQSIHGGFEMCRPQI
jgi:hypothetical protein